MFDENIEDEEVESRLSFIQDHCCGAGPAPDGPLPRESTEFRRSYKLSCAIRCVSIADPRLFGAGASLSVSIALGTPGPTSCGSISSPTLANEARSDDILRFVP